MKVGVFGQAMKSVLPKCFVGSVSERGAFLIFNVFALVELDFRFKTNMYIINYIMAYSWALQYHRRNPCNIGEVEMLYIEQQ